jgi:hypothetical protein
MPGPVAAARTGQAAAAVVAQPGIRRLAGPACGQVQPGAGGDVGGAQLAAEGDRATAVIVGVDRLNQDGATGGFRDRGGQDRGPAFGRAGIVLPVRLVAIKQAASQLPPVQAVGECHVTRLETPPLHGTSRRPGGWQGQERRQHVLALDRDREPVQHLIGHPDRRLGYGRQRQAVRGADRDMPGSGGRGEADPRRDRVRAQLCRILAGRLDVHGGHGHPGGVQQPGRCLLPVTVDRQRISGRRVQQPHQLPFSAPNPQPQRHRPVTGIVGEHDEVMAVYGTADRQPAGPGISNHDADIRHGGPPDDSKTATRPILVSARRPATGYPPAGG